MLGPTDDLQSSLIFGERIPKVVGSLHVQRDYDVFC
jgi:hypothetical protein